MYLLIQDNLTTRLNLVKQLGGDDIIVFNSAGHIEPQTDRSNS